MPKNKIAKIDLKDAIVNGMLEKKANKITVLDLRKLSSAMADYFIICHATSDKQVNAIADSIEEIVRKQTGEKPWHVEGSEQSDWILLDYFDIVAHVFKEEKRDFYAIEELWGDAEITEIDESNPFMVLAPKAKAKAKSPAKAKTTTPKAKAAPKAKVTAKAKAKVK